ncbi:Rxlr-like protein, partial [Globisporangium splendens]
MRSLLLLCAAVIAAALAVAPASADDGFQGELFSDAYYKWHYRWHRGGAWMFHEELHPCLDANQTCEFVARKDDERLGMLHVNTTIVKHLASVNVSFNLHTEEAKEGDIVAVYCVDDEDERSAATTKPGDFFDYVFVNASQQHTGSIVFGPLVNMRCSYQFRYIRLLSADENTYQVVAESAHVEMEEGHSQPLHVRLALTGNLGEMRVMWNSGRVDHVHVHYGTSPEDTSRHAEATTETYEATDMCSDPATTTSAMYYRHPGYMHDGLMKDLIPGETYFYKVGSKYGLTSATFSFTYPPAPGSSPDGEASNSSQSFFVFGDLGQSVLQPRLGAAERHFTSLEFQSRLAKPDDPQTVMKRIEQDLEDDAASENYVALIHIGDLSYAKGRTYIWDQFGAIAQPVASQLPYMVGIGNHEYDYLVNGAGHDLSGSAAANANGWHPSGGNFRNDSKGECGVPSVKRFHMPENGNKLFWYSFSVGLTHHIVLSSEHQCDADSPMRKWFERELKRVDRKLTPWLIVHLHRPLYCSENYDGDYFVSHILRNCLEHLMMEYRVDVVFSGHYHAYERTCPVFNDNCRHKKLPDGQEKALATTHIMIGSAGAELDDVDYMSAKWSHNRQQEYGYGRLHVFNATHAYFEFLRTRDRVVSDSKWIISDHDWTYRRGE